MKLRNMIALLLVLALVGVPVAGATEIETADSETVQIHTIEELQAIAENPSGSYILMEDLDMTGVEWMPLDYSGSFDGNGHALLNLTLTQPGAQKPKSYDGNRKDYETAYVGLFGTLINAEVKNLKLINVRAVIESDEPCFLAGLAGYAENTTISGCTVTGCLELRAHDRMFGVGGIVGYGSGYVQQCQADVTLITVDTDASTKDEQFLGGIYGTGFMDVTQCQVVIDGYVSEHGYVHSGGVVGMYMDYPFGKTRKGVIEGNDVKGKITFFEDNTSRRAYCKAVVGERLVDWYSIQNNNEEFQRDERTDYTLELRPEMCAEAEYAETVIQPTCTEYGYTIYQCYTCGYCYADHYTPFQHTVTEWMVKEAATVEQEGISEGACDGCGIVLQRTEPKLEPAPTTEPAVPTTQAPETTEATEQSQPAPQQQPQSADPILKGCAWAVGILSVLALLTLPGMFKRK